MGQLRLEELSATTAVAANTLTLRPGQEPFVIPTTYAIADAWLDPTKSWPRVVMDDDRVVGFVRGNFDPDTDDEAFRCSLRRIHVAADTQGMGVGRFAVEGVADEARRRGFDHLSVLWEPGEEGPEQFFLHCGFVITSQTEYGENVGQLKL